MKKKNEKKNMENFQNKNHQSDDESVDDEIDNLVIVTHQPLFEIGGGGGAQEWVE